MLPSAVILPAVIMLPPVTLAEVVIALTLFIADITLPDKLNATALTTPLVKVPGILAEAALTTPAVTTLPPVTLPVTTALAALTALMAMTLPPITLPTALTLPEALTRPMADKLVAVSPVLANTATLGVPFTLTLILPLAPLITRLLSPSAKDPLVTLPMPCTAKDPPTGLVRMILSLLDEIMESPSLMVLPVNQRLAHRCVLDPRLYTLLAAGNTLPANVALVVANTARLLSPPTLTATLPPGVTMFTVLLPLTKLDAVVKIPVNNAPLPRK